jgi:hypothetical protein
MAHVPVSWATLECISKMSSAPQAGKERCVRTHFFFYWQIEWNVVSSLICWFKAIAGVAVKLLIRYCHSRWSALTVLDCLGKGVSVTLTQATGFHIHHSSFSYLSLSWIISTHSGFLTIGLISVPDVDCSLSALTWHKLWWCTGFRLPCSEGPEKHHNYKPCL